MEKDPVCGMQVDPKSAAGQAQAIGKFGRFFLGGLWDSYVARVPGASG